MFCGLQTGHMGWGLPPSRGAGRGQVETQPPGTEPWQVRHCLGCWLLRSCWREPPRRAGLSRLAWPCCRPYLSAPGGAGMSEVAWADVLNLREGLPCCGHVGPRIGLCSHLRKSTTGELSTYCDLRGPVSPPVCSITPLYMGEGPEGPSWL